MKTMQHEGYIATIEWDESAGFFHGEVSNTRDILTFQGRTLDDLRQAFIDTLDDYRAWCQARGKIPEHPYSGHFPVRVSPALHCRAAAVASREGKTLDSLIAELLEHRISSIR